MKGCVITVDGNECYRFSGTPDSQKIPITCTKGVLNGTIIKVSKSNPPVTSDLNYTINMCEFQVFSTLKFSFITPFLIIINNRFYIALFSALEQTHCARM